MSISAGKLRQSLVLIIIIGVAIGLVVLYFFIYVKDKEEYVNKRNYKVLINSAESIRRKVNAYTNRDITQNFLQYNLDYILKNNKARYPSCNDLIADNLKLQLKSEIEDDKFPMILDDLKSVSNKFVKSTTSQPIAAELKLGRDGWGFSFRDTINVCQANNIIECPKGKPAYCKRFLAESHIPVQMFVSALLQPNIFDEYIVVNTSGQEGEILYESHPLGSRDSIKNYLKKSSPEVQLSGVDYKIFAYKFSVQKNEWALIGLQSWESYLNETRNFDRSVLYTSILITLIVLLSLPWIKVVLISKNEKLNRIDVTLCAFSFLLGCFLWTVIIVSLDHDYLYNKNDLSKSHLSKLATQIDSAFEEEVLAAYKTLKMADTNFQACDITNVAGGKTIACANDSKENIAFNPSYKAFDFITWIDSSGLQKFKWATAKKPTRKIDVSNRPYFRNAFHHDLWPLNERGDSIAFESIRSWNNGWERANIAIWKKDSLPVVSIQSQLKSVIDCVLPPGYKFCIADKAGVVLFHSNSEKNLNENIFEECDIKYDVGSILYSKEKVSRVVYENRPHDFYIKPLKQFPLFLITMRDHSAEAQSKAYVIEVTFVLVISHVVLIMLAILTIWFTWRRSLRQFPVRRSSDWLKPDEGKMREYVKIAILNLALAFLYLPFFYARPMDEVFIFFVAPLYILPVFYLFLNNQNVSDFFNNQNRVLIFFMLFFILVMNGMLISVRAEWPVFVFQITLLLVVASWLYISQNTAKFKSIHLVAAVREFLKRFSLRTSYSLALSSLFLAIAIIPAFEFHRKAFNLERMKYTMMLQSGTAKEFLSKETEDARIYRVDEPVRLNTDSLLSVSQNWDSLKIGRLAKLIGPMLDASGLNFLRRDDEWHVLVGNSPWRWYRSDDLLAFSRVPWETSQKSLRLVSHVQKYGFPRLTVWIYGIIALVFLFIFLRYLVTRIFIFDVNRNLTEADLFLLTTETHAQIKKNDERSWPPFSNHLFIIGLPFSGKRDYVDKLYPPSPPTRLTLDLVELDLQKPWNSTLPNKEEMVKYEVIIIDHFEFDFQNIPRNNLKLQLLEHLFLTWKKKIVILSTIHTTQLLEQYNDDNILRERWNAVFSHFYAIFYPLQKVRLSKGAIMAEFGITEEHWRKNHHYYEFIEKECNHGLFLRNLRPTMYSLVDIANKDHLTLEELSEKVKSLAYTYYASIWSTCSKDERFLIYDLAEDGLVNVKNAPSIIHLIYKGVFTQKRTLSIMNRSFRNFVLTYVNPEEVRAMRKDTLTHGTWSSVKGPILFILAIGLLFLLYTQRGLANEIMAFLGALIAAIPVFLRALGSFDSPSKPKH